MVNTRRTGGSLNNSSTNLRTTRRSVNTTPGGSSSISESESEESHAEDNSCNFTEKKFTKTKKKLVLPRERELRSHFTFNKYNSDRHIPTKKSRRLLSERRRLGRFSSRKMADDTDSSNANFEDELYSFRRRPYRLRVPENLNRMERRTALSLRPITRKNYFDDQSLTFNEGRKIYPKRTRTVRFKNTSWIADDRMHKVGYPNLTYSEEDSRDVQENNVVEETRCNTRQNSSMSEVKRENKKNSDYVYYDNSDRHHKRRNDSSILEQSSRELRSRNSNENDSMLRRLRSQAVQDKVEIKLENEPMDCEGQNNYQHTNGNIDSENKKEDSTEEKKSQQNKDSSDSDMPLKLPKGRRQNANRDETFMLPDTRNNRKNSTSSDTSDDEKKMRDCRRQQPMPSADQRPYSFRQRPPKPPPQPIRENYSSRNPIRLMDKRKYTRERRRARRSSSSSSSSSSDEEIRVSKPPKSPHCKNDPRMKRKSVAGGSTIMPIAPETLDVSVRFSSIGGLDSHIQCLKEMIILPMMYPEVFQQFHIKPPRGVLFHGPPGTGKTMMARALANECSLGKRKVSFFMRKGADLLSKWIGESEKQLRLLFEQASEMKPSIIFFDELDGLIPVRSSRNDQIHASIVSTLLALMDGLDDRGEIIVVGATNRIDSIDPAFRRPGRFDRELYFPLPARKEREEILSVHVAKWLKPPNQQLLSYLAEQAVGYCGSDLRALCTEAVIQSFKRTYPQVYDSEHKLLLKPEDVNVKRLDFMKAKAAIVPAAHRTNQSMSRKLLPILEPLLGDYLKNILSVLEDTFPQGVHLKLARIKLSANYKLAQVLLTADGSEHGHTRYLAPAIIYKMEHIQCYCLDLTTLYRESNRSQEEATLQVFTEAKRNVPSIIYIPCIDTFWHLVSETTKAIFLDQLQQLDPHLPILLLATSDTTYKELPEKIRKLFSTHQKEVFPIKTPNLEQRKAFFRHLVIEGSLKPVRLPRKKFRKPPPLPRAPSPPLLQLSEEEVKKLYEKEEHTLRELRIFLRDMCHKLARNKMFYLFTKPVDIEEVPDYTTIIKQPMDLETMMMKVDFHRYECAKDFLADIELIVQNALEYNPAKTSVDKQIRHRACSLRDYAYTLIKTEMDSDFEDKCQEISKSRKQRRTKVKHLPEYLETPEILDRFDIVNDNDPEEQKTQEKLVSPVTSKNVTSKKRRQGLWQKGLLRSNKRRKREKLSIGGDEEEKKATDKSSGDESKENNPYLDVTVKEEPNKSPANENLETPAKTSSENTYISPTKSGNTHSPSRRLSDIMSPSELLEDPVYFDGTDQVLNESGDQLVSNEPIEVSIHELEMVLDQVVKLTVGHSLQSLLELHSRLSKVVTRHLRTPCRTQLPKDLKRELNKFKKEETTDAQSDSSQSSMNV